MSTTYYVWDKSQRLVRRQSDFTEVRYFTFNERNMVTQIQDFKVAGGGDANRYFTYNAVGERVIVVDGAEPRYWSYDQDNLIQENDNAGKVVGHYRYAKKGGCKSRPRAGAGGGGGGGDDPSPFPMLWPGPNPWPGAAPGSQGPGPDPGPLIEEDFPRDHIDALKAYPVYDGDGNIKKKIYGGGAAPPEVYEATVAGVDLGATDLLKERIRSGNTPRATTTLTTYLPPRQTYAPDPCVTLCGRIPTGIIPIPPGPDGIGDPKHTPAVAPPSCCGPNVTKAVFHVLDEAKTYFDSLWGRSLSGESKSDLCGSLAGLTGLVRANQQTSTGGYAHTQFDIVDLFLRGGGMLPRAGGWNTATNGRCGFPSACSRTVEFVGECHNSAIVNYVFWGFLTTLCVDAGYTYFVGEDLYKAARLAWAVRQNSKYGDVPYDEQEGMINTGREYAKGHGMKPPLPPTSLPPKVVGLAATYGSDCAVKCDQEVPVGSLSWRWNDTWHNPPSTPIPGMAWPPTPVAPPP